MRAITVRPGTANSARLEQVAEPRLAEGALLIRARALGVCGTEREIVSGEYGWAPPGEERLVLGHESLGIVEQAPHDSGFARGDWVVGIVRRPDPVPCPAGRRAGAWHPPTLAATGAGPIGLLAGGFGVKGGLEIHVPDRVGEVTKP